MGEAPKLPPRLGLFSASTIIIGSMIGSGIFVAPSIMAGYVQSPAMLLGLWVVGGLLSLLGAMAYSELAAAMPRAGGQYVFLQRAFGRLWGFLYGWTFLFAINTGLIAAVAVAFAKYVGVFIPSIGEGTILFTLGRPFSSAQAVALLVVLILTWVNVTGLRMGAMVQNTFTVGKVAAIAVLVLLGFALGRGSVANFQSAGGALDLGPQGVTMGLFAAMAVAMSKALFAYDAWNSATLAAEEVKDPERNLVRSMLLGTIGVTFISTAAVAVYVYMVPMGEMAGVRDNRIGAEAARRMLGSAGEKFVAAAILVSAFGCVNGLVLSGARVVYAMARDGLFFPAGAAIHPVYRTPARALVIQGGVAAILTLTGTYSDLLTLTAFSSLLFNTLTVSGLFVLRRTAPGMPRPYRAWGYPVLPFLYVAVSAFFLVFILKGDPRNSGMGLLLTALGLPAYLYWRSRAAPAGH